MKKLKFTLVLFLSIFMLFGCKDKWEAPEFRADEWVPPAGTQVEQFYTIGPNNVNRRYILPRLHTPGDPPSSIISPEETLLHYLRAVVVSSDEGGNYYKSLVVQDSTGGIELQLDMTGLHALYPVGQKLVIVLNGLVVGDYNRLSQIGWIYEGTQGPQVGRINSLYFDTYIIRDGLPSLKNLPKILTNDEIQFESFDEGGELRPSTRDVNKLVRLEGVRFEPSAFGKPIADDRIITNWVIDAPWKGEIKKVTVRTSNFARFRNTIIEDRPYNLTGILTIFGDTYQFMIRTKDDIEPLTPPSPEEFLTFDFTSNPIGEWSILSRLESGTQWGFRNNSIMHFGNTIIGYDRAMDDWFISPEITYSDLAGGYLRFEHQISVLNANYDAYQVYYTTSNATDFNFDDWHSLGTLSSFHASYGLSNKFPLSNIGANTFRIAFRYETPGIAVETYEWRIRKMEIRNR